MSEVIKTTASSVFVDDHGMLHIVSNGTQSTAQTARETFAAAASMLMAPAPTLLDARAWPKARSDFWVEFIDMLPTVTSAGALLVAESGVRDLGGFPGAVNRLMVPFEVFTDEEEAVAFLRQFLPEPD